MSRIFKNLLVICLIGGGFMGTVLTTTAMIESNGLSSLRLFLFFFFIILYLASIYAGFKVIDNSQIGIKLARILFAMQIPVIYTTSFIYSFFSAFKVVIQKQGEEFGFVGTFGSGFDIFFSPNGSVSIIGLNIFALLIFIKLLKTKL